MKKILIPISALLISGFAEAQLSPTENYISSKTYLDYNGTTATKTVETVQYFDGLGRPKQVVNVKASPLGRDVVTPFVYDNFGRQVKDYLPIPQKNTLNGAIIPNPMGNAALVYGSEKIYAEKVLENSPLDRIQQQIQVGNNWSNKPVKFDYNANIHEDYVRKYETTTTWINNATHTTVKLVQYFLPAQLYKNTVTDEDGNKTIEFKNGQGQTVLVRKVLSATDNADTYYVYNEYNQLAFVIPPLASAPKVEGSTMENLYYQYRYDGRNRLVEKKVPGKGWEHMVYDKADRLIFTQDDEMRKNSKWLFSKYDNLGRVIYTGFIDAGLRPSLQATANNYIVTDSRSSTGFARNGMQVYYTNVLFNEIQTLLSVNYYDTYPSYSFNPPFPGTILNQPLLTEAPDAQGLSTKSLPVMSMVKNIEDDNWTKNYTYYDTRGRSVGSYSINHLGGRTQVFSALDFSGVPKQSITRHKRLATDTDKVITENFTYDHQNRLLRHSHQVDSNPVEYLAQNKYNELSQLENKKVGGTSVVSPLQSIDYAYNIRGWMTKINDPKNLGGKLFGYEIKYHDPSSSFAISRYNGNIGEVDWKTSNDNILKRYSYSYDSLNRLNYGHYSEPMSTVPTENHFGESVEYDLNGNITRLYRNTKNTANGKAMQIDNLTYKYFGNQLRSVKDESQNNSGYPYFATPNPMEYDNNGNIKFHKDKMINKIVYNYLNLPSSINMLQRKGLGSFQGNMITHKYRSDGVKLEKTVNFVNPYTADLTNVEYLDGFQYERKYNKSNTSQQGSDSGYVLQFVPNSEGYFDFVKNKYIYNYTDHLGNVRLSYLKNGNSIAVLDENNYYPFGLRHEGVNVLPGNPNYQYQYNGKELQMETGMYDYGARFYMPDIGRWGVVDPLAEVNRAWSPYRYAYNNPIRFIDPDGRLEDWYQDNETQNIEWYEGSAEISGKTNLTAINNTRVLGVENGQTVQEFNLNSDGSFTAGGKTFNNGESATTLIGTTITSKPGFDLGKWLSHLGNEGGDFYANLGGAAPLEYSNPFFRGDIDKIVDAGGYFGGMVNGLSRGNDWKDLMAYRVDIMALGDLAFSAAGSTSSSSNTVAANSDTLSFYGSQAVGLNIYRGSGDRITGVGVKTQDVYKTNMSRSQKDSMINRVNADGAIYDRKSDSVLRRIMKSR